MSAIDITALACVSPGALQRAQRVQLAIDMLRRGAPESRVAASIRAEFSVSRRTAYRAVEVARDLA